MEKFYDLEERDKTLNLEDTADYSVKELHQRGMMKCNASGVHRYEYLCT